MYKDYEQYFTQKPIRRAKREQIPACSGVFLPGTIVSVPNYMQSISEVPNPPNPIYSIQTPDPNDLRPVNEIAGPQSIYGG